MKKVAVLFAPGFEEMEAITPVDLLTRAGAHVDKIGVGGKVIKGSHNIEINCDFDIEAIHTEKTAELYDAIVIPGGMPGAKNLANSSLVSDFITNHWVKQKLIAAICASPAVVLSPLGLFAGEEVTCYPSFETLFGEEVNFTGQNVVVSNNLITAKGPGKSIPFALAIVETLYDESKVDELSEGIIF